MSRWNTDQDNVLREYASRGVQEVQRVLRRMGADHSLAAIRVRASRLGVSLERYEICPGCGGRYKTLGTDGLCAACHVGGLLEAERNRVIQNAKATPEYLTRRREYDRLRQRRHRAKQSDCED